MTDTKITVRYSAVDGFRMTRTFKTLRGAQRFAQRYVGEFPEQGRGYAVSDDGVGKVTCTGCTLRDLFTAQGADPVKAIACSCNKQTLYWAGCDCKASRYEDEAEALATSDPNSPFVPYSCDCPF